MHPSNLDGNYPQDFDYHFFSRLLEEHVKNKPERLCFPRTCYLLRQKLVMSFKKPISQRESHQQKKQKQKLSILNREVKSNQKINHTHN